MMYFPICLIRFQGRILKNQYAIHIQEIDFFHSETMGANKHLMIPRWRSFYCYLGHEINWVNLPINTLIIQGLPISPETTLKNRRNPTSPRDNTCQSLGLIFPCNKVLMVDSVILGVAPSQLQWFSRRFIGFPLLYMDSNPGKGHCYLEGATPSVCIYTLNIYIL